VIISGIDSPHRRAGVPFWMVPWRLHATRIVRHFHRLCQRDHLGGQTVKFEQSHLGICVSNLERSLTFYRDGLGFQDGPSFEINYPI
jgi:hypothetical protein